MIIEVLAGGTWVPLDGWIVVGGDGSATIRDAVSESVYPAERWRWPRQPARLRMVCQHCGVLIREGDDGPGGPSHGICGACLAEHYPEEA